MGIGVEPTYDMNLVREIMLTPEIWERAAEDGSEPKDFYPGYDELCCWLLVKEEDKIIGLILLHHDNSTTLKFHPYMMKEFFSKSREMMKEFYKWLLENTPDLINKVIVSIPDNQKKTYNFAKKVGFQDEGFNRESYRKNGEIHGLFNLGITRQEASQWVT